jgi:hypothetical protein
VLDAVFSRRCRDRGMYAERERVVELVLVANLVAKG